MSLSRAALWAPPLVWMGLIFFLSAQPEPGELSPIPFEVDDRVAHIALYTVLGALLWRAARRSGGRMLERKPGRWTLALGWIYGLSDELHQAFVPRRSATVEDFIIDGAGVGLGIAIAFLTLLFVRRR